MIYTNAKAPIYWSWKNHPIVSTYLNILESMVSPYIIDYNYIL